MYCNSNSDHLLSEFMWLAIKWRVGMDVEADKIVIGCPGVDLYPDGRALPNSDLSSVARYIRIQAKRAYCIYLPASLPPKYEGPVSPGLVLNRPFLSATVSLFVHPFTPYHVVPLPPNRFLGCWVVRPPSAALEH